MFHVSRFRLLSIALAVVVGAAFSAHAKEEAKNDLERLYDEFNQITLDISKGFAVKNLLLEHDSFSATLEDGNIFFSNKIGDQLYVAVFLGRGKMTIDIPEPVKDMQFRNILWLRESMDPSNKDIKDQPFAQAFLVVPQDVYELLSGERKVPGSEVTAATEGKLPEKRRERAKKLFRRQAGPPDWREIPVRVVVWHHLNNFPNEHFEFRANTEDFEWVRYRFNPNLERECNARRISYETAWGRRQVIWRGGVNWDRREDYRQDEGGWTANLRKRLHEDRRPIEILHYDMDITVETDVFLKNRMTMRIRPRKEGVRCAWFEFWSHIPDYNQKAFIIKKCTDAGGNPLPFFHDRNELLVDMGKPMETGKDYTVALEYEAKFVWLDGDYPWYPQVGAMENEATYDVKVRVPLKFTMGASGTTVKRWEEPGYECLHTRLDKPVRNFAVFFGEYQRRFSKLYDVEEAPETKEFAEKWGNPTISVYGSQRQNLPDRLAQACSFLQFYSQYFQMPFPYDELDIFTASKMRPHTPGLVQASMENNRYLAHQLAHQWWPEITGMRNYHEDAWLSEGFAEYAWGLSLEFFKEQRKKGSGAAALSEEAETQWLMGPEGGFYGRGILTLEPYKQASLYSPGGSYKPSLRFSRWESYKTQVHRKGPYVLHMLRQILGPELFRALLTRFLRDFAGRQPVTPDFIDTVKKVVGEYMWSEPFRAYRESKTPVAEWPRETRNQFLLLDDFYKNLDDWFEDWYIDPGHAKIRFYWSVQEDAEKDGYVFTGRIKQDPEEFKLVLAPITLRFKKHRALKQRFFVDEPDYEFQLHVPGEPTEVVFDELKTLAAAVTAEEEWK
ncbi:MAG: hypothetical protein JSV08_10015 [Acidobacteriota bacterium]|nr:MAG: hypothetical protein JSV08_10015 [Acidobacteriota bacterium]